MFLDFVILTIPVILVSSFAADSIVTYSHCQARTGRGIHGLPKVSCRTAMPDPYTPCRRATPQTALRPFGGRPAAVYFPLGYPIPYGPVTYSHCLHLPGEFHDIYPDIDPDIYYI
jgi:hypothetical protein